MDYTKEVQEIAKKLFAEGKIDYFVGYKKNSYNDEQVPSIITDAKDADGLVFNNKSSFNLTNYLKHEHTHGKRVGLVVKGCDSRALNLLLTESQVKRENVHVIGVACEGVVDEKGVKMQNCEECICNSAVVYDDFLGTKTEVKPYAVNVDVKDLMSKDLLERGAIFESIFENCIRCNACRHSCPLCYCEKCCIDQETSALYNGANTLPNATHALLTWSLHLAGRCVDCRNCEKACPSNLPLHLLHKHNEMVINENFQNHIAGVEEGDRGAFYKYSLNDPDKFIM